MPLRALSPDSHQYKQHQENVNIKSGQEINHSSEVEDGCDENSYHDYRSYDYRHNDANIHCVSL
jgi:hypothetical protein